MKWFRIFIDTIYWIWLFILPLIPVCILSIWLYDRTAKNIPYIILLAIVGSITGAWLAERVRKRDGLSSFFGKMLSTPDIADKSAIESPQKADGTD
jgi:hypothetical protein